LILLVVLNRKHHNCYELVFLLFADHSKAALDPCVEVHIEGLILTSPAIHVQPSHPIIKVSTFYVCLSF
jgi:hypothetical protein